MNRSNLEKERELEILDSLEITETEEDFPKGAKRRKEGRIEKLKETSEKASFPRKEIEKFLRERSMSRSFVNVFLKIGFTEEFQR